MKFFPHVFYPVEVFDGPALTITLPAVVGLIGLFQRCVCALGGGGGLTVFRLHKMSKTTHLLCHFDCVWLCSGQTCQPGCPLMSFAVPPHPPLSDHTTTHIWHRTRTDAGLSESLQRTGRLRMRSPVLSSLDDPRIIMRLPRASVSSANLTVTRLPR